jgi:hypothetical protein
MSKPTVENELSKIDQIIHDNSEQALDSSKPTKAPQRVDQVIWGVWWVGTILIVLSWFSVVSHTLGWIGFAAALASAVVSVILRRYWKFPE